MTEDQETQMSTLTVQQAAQRLGIDVPTLVAWLADRNGPKAMIRRRHAGGFVVQLSAAALQPFIDNADRPAPIRCRPRRPYALRRFIRPN